MFQRRRVASTSSLVVWCVGADSLDACGSSSARADTSHTVTGRPPSATLAWRRISRLPSTNVSGPLTEAPSGAHGKDAAVDACGRRRSRSYLQLLGGGAHYICDIRWVASSNA